MSETVQRIGAAMTLDLKPWRYSINYGPDGEQNYANVYDGDGQFVGNLRIHHAIAVVTAYNAASNYSGWRSIDTAPEDEHVILATSGGHTGEALMLIDEDTGQRQWVWAHGPVHQKHEPWGWMPMQDPPSAPVLSDLRPSALTAQQEQNDMSTITTARLSRT